MAISTFRVFLMSSTDGSNYTKLIDIKSFPDLGGEPELLETTTLSDRMQTYIAGIQSLDALAFTANYDLQDYQALLALEGETLHYAVWFGGTGSGSDVVPTGDDGKFAFDGQLTTWATGGGVNAVVDLNISIAPATEIKLVP